MDDIFIKERFNCLKTNEVRYLAKSRNPTIHFETFFQNIRKCSNVQKYGCISLE